MIRRAILTTLCLASTATAGPISFATGWQEQRLSLFSNNSYSFGNQLSMASDGGVSIAYTRLGRDKWGSTRASWSWTVEKSVPATNLRSKGGDDRNLALYFVFLPEDQAAAAEGAGIRGLLRNGDARVLLYTWGGNHGRGEQFLSPYMGGQGMNVALRPAGTGSFSENVDLAADYARAFGGQPGALVGIAVSGDSDDTDSMIRAAIGNMVLG